MEMTKECPICQKEIVSELATEYCALCGMQVEFRDCVVSKLGSYSKYFCGKTCYGKYKKFHSGKEVKQIV